MNESESTLVVVVVVVVVVSFTYGSQTYPAGHCKHFAKPAMGAYLPAKQAVDLDDPFGA